MPRGTEVLQNLEPKRLFTHSQPTQACTRFAKGVRDGICVDPPLCTSQGFYGLKAIGLVCVGEAVRKIGEVDEMSERELVLMVSVRCGMEWDMTRG